jgi:hypothetical protein
MSAAPCPSGAVPIKFLRSASKKRQQIVEPVFANTKSLRRPCPLIHKLNGERYAQRQIGLRGPARRSSDERPDDLSRPLALILRDPLQRCGVVSIESDLHNKMAVTRRLDDLHICRIDLLDLLIEVPRLRI